MSRSKRSVLAGLTLVGLSLLAVGAAGAQSVRSGLAAGTDDRAPNAVTGLVTDVDLAGPSITLTWNLSVSDKVRQQPTSTDFTSYGVFSRVNDVAGYQVWRAAFGGSLELVTTVAAGVGRYTDATVVSGTTYTYQVKAVDKAGNASSAVTSEPLSLGPPPVISVTPPAAMVESLLRFGEVASGRGASARFSVNNLAVVEDAAALRVTIAVTGAGFASDRAALSIAKGAADTFTVSFSATAPQNLNGNYTGTLTLSTNDPVNRSITYGLTATVTGGPVAVVNLSASQINFGASKVDSAVSRTLTISNAGELALTGNVSFTGSAEFSVAGTGAISLAANGSADVVVTFTPTAEAANYIGLITITSNDATQPAVTVAVAGSGRSAVPILIDPVTGTEIKGDWSGGEGTPDGKIDFDDFFVFADHFGETAPSGAANAIFDISGPDGVPDGKIDFDDFFAFADFFGKTGVYQ